MHLGLFKHIKQLSPFYLMAVNSINWMKFFQHLILKSRIRRKFFALYLWWFYICFVLSSPVCHFISLWSFSEFLFKNSTMNSGWSKFGCYIHIKTLGNKRLQTHTISKCLKCLGRTTLHLLFCGKNMLSNKLKL